MRLFWAVLAIAPSIVSAETFVIPSQTTSALIYSEFGVATHTVTLDLPAGRHQLVFPDLPPDIWMESLRMEAPGVKLGAVRTREDFVPPRPDANDPDIEAAEARIEAVEDQIRDLETEVARLELRRDAAKDRISFLQDLGKNEGLAASTATLQETVRMIGAETLAARTEILDVDVAVRGFEDQFETLEEALEEAEAALEALVPEVDERPYVVVDVTAPTALDSVVFLISFASETSWRPAYDVRLTETETGAIVTLDRYAVVEQSTGENWDDVQLTLSSETPSDATDPSSLWPDLRRLVDPEALQARRAVAVGQLSAMSETVMEAPVIVEDAAASADIVGLNIEWSFPTPVNVATDADAVRIPFDTLTFDAEIVARAVPLAHEIAFLIAKVTNTSGEPLIADWEAPRFFEGALVGIGELPDVAIGESFELGFGAIRGLQIERTVLNRAEEDRGIISRSNQKSEKVRIDVENLTERAWDVELRDRVPYSEQEDLEITYRATPTPTTRAVDDKRGVLEWRFDLGPSDTATFETEFEMTWPEGQIVR